MTTASSVSGIMTCVTHCMYTFDSLSCELRVVHEKRTACHATKQPGSTQEHDNNVAALDSDVSGQDQRQTAPNGSCAGTSIVAHFSFFSIVHV